MKGFKLHMHQCDFDQRRQICSSMNELLQIAQQLINALWWWRYKNGLAGESTTYPVLRAPQLARLLARTTHPVHQQPMCIAQQSYPDGQARRVAQVAFHQLEGTQVVGDFFNVIGTADRKTRFAVEKVNQRGLRTLYLQG